MNEQLNLNEDSSKSHPDKKQTYDKFRDQVIEPDELIIERGREQSRGYGDAGMAMLLNGLSGETAAPFKEILIKKIADKPLADIGCGKYGGGYAENFYNRYGDKKFYDRWGQSSRKYTDFHPSKIVCVDLFITPEEFAEKAGGELRPEISFIQNDGLNFLSLLPGNSSNVLFSNIDFALIPDENYHTRLAQEAFRVVPDDGILILSGASQVERQASKMFLYSLIIDASIKLFSNTPFGQAEQIK